MPTDRIESASLPSSSAPAPEISGLLARPLAARLRMAIARGKIGEDELDDVLSFNARSILDSEDARLEWIPLDDFDSLLAGAAPLLGDEPAIAEFAAEIVEAWAHEPAVLSILDASQRLVDAPGYAVVAASELLTRSVSWAYRGGRSGFSVDVAGLAGASVATRVFLGAALARLAECPSESMDDVRFEGVDGDALRIFGTHRRRPQGSGGDSEPHDRSPGENRLHRAALIG